MKERPLFVDGIVLGDLQQRQEDFPRHDDFRCVYTETTKVADLHVY